MAEGFLMEVCVDSVESALNAERGGAGRLELCCSLMEGGLTPSLGLLQIVKRCVKIPVYVMIRPRGGDFLYSDWEVEVMKKDIEEMQNHGADGFVLGALTEEGQVDAELCMEFLAAARPLPITFHRAFDMVSDPVVALETLASLGFQRVLTSGCDGSALEGLPLIKRLVEQVLPKRTNMPGISTTDRGGHRGGHSRGRGRGFQPPRGQPGTRGRFRYQSTRPQHQNLHPYYGGPPLGKRQWGHLDYHEQTSKRYPCLLLITPPSEEMGAATSGQHYPQQR